MLLDNVAKKIIKLNAGKIKISNPNQVINEKIDIFHPLLIYQW